MRTGATAATRAAAVERGTTGEAKRRRRAPGEPPKDAGREWAVGAWGCSQRRRRLWVEEGTEEGRGKRDLTEGMTEVAEVGERDRLWIERARSGTEPAAAAMETFAVGAEAAKGAPKAGVRRRPMELERV